MPKGIAVSMDNKVDRRKIQRKINNDKNVYIDT